MVLSAGLRETNAGLAADLGTVRAEERLDASEGPLDQSYDRRRRCTTTTTLQGVAMARVGATEARTASSGRLKR
jgi:hypothetical protein